MPAGQARANLIQPPRRTCSGNPREGWRPWLIAGCDDWKTSPPVITSQDFEKIGVSRVSLFGTPKRQAVRFWSGTPGRRAPVVMLKSSCRLPCRCSSGKGLCRVSLISALGRRLRLHELISPLKAPTNAPETIIPKRNLRVFIAMEGDMTAPPARV